jgi:hypothetical protein
MALRIDSIKVSGFIILFIGVGVLLFTVYNAYLLMTGVLGIEWGSEDLMRFFGEALAPLIVYAIKALYLGIMGWIGSILTRRGIQTLTVKREETKVEVANESKRTKKTNESKNTK